MKTKPKRKFEKEKCESQINLFMKSKCNKIKWQPIASILEIQTIAELMSMCHSKR